MRYHSNATSVVLIAANGDFWLWFTLAPGQLEPEFVTGNQIADPATVSDSERGHYGVGDRSP